MYLQGNQRRGMLNDLSKALRYASSDWSFVHATPEHAAIARAGPVIWLKYYGGTTAQKYGGGGGPKHMFPLYYVKGEWFTLHLTQMKSLHLETKTNQENKSCSGVHLYIIISSKHNGTMQIRI